MFRQIILTIFSNIWPMILIFTVILTTIRIVYLYSNNKKFVFYKEALMLGFVIYILCLFHVVTFQDVSWSTSNFTPFKEIFRYDFGSGLFFRNVVGNMIMFVPYGFFVGYVLKNNQTKVIVLITLITSITIETTQLVIGRVFDIDDILLNLIGGLIGFYLFRFCKNIQIHLPKLLKK